LPKAKLMNRKFVIVCSVAFALSCIEHDLTRSWEGLVTMPGAAVIVPADPAQRSEDTVQYRVSHVRANEAVTWVSDRLTKLLWQPLAADWNDGQPNSFVEGWSCHPGVNGRILYVWVGDWMNKYGDVVTYSFTSSDVRATRDILVVATVLGKWHVRKKVEATGNPNLELSTRCAQFLNERR
jgi:hypothetical protein